MAVRWKKSKKPTFGQIPQPSIFDVPVQAERQKIEGMEAAYNHADSEWKRAATAYLHELIGTKQFVTSEEVVLYLNSKGIVTGENRAMGAIMSAFARAGLIRSTGRFTESRRPECHKSPVRIWESIKMGGCND